MVVAALLLAPIGALAAGMSDRAAPAEASPAPGDWASVRCESCHRPAHGFSHPVDVRASGPVPEWLPLRGGQITCMTCHDPGSPEEHGKAGRTRRPERGPSPSEDSPGRQEADPGDSNKSLRGGGTAAELCLACHGDGRGASTADLHAIGGAAAHVRWDSPASAIAPPRRLAGGFGGDAMLDEESALCLSCHDGMAAKDVRYAERPFSLLGSHPIGVAYRSQRGSRLRHEQGLDPRVGLVDGRVGCGTCHSVYSRVRDLLVMSNERSALCLECHEP